jgi:hypothetical protein
MTGEFDNIIIGKLINNKLYVSYYDIATKSIKEFSNKTKARTSKEYELDIQINSNPGMVKQELERYKLDSKGLHFIESLKAEWSRPN